jgi:hypothetical protein
MKATTRNRVQLVRVSPLMRGEESLKKEIEI